MRKILLILAMVAGVFMMQAGTYNYLVFTDTGGNTTAFTVTNLTLTVNGSNLRVSNDDGTVNLVLTDLATMQFSANDTATAIGNVLNADETVQVFSITGTAFGSFSSLVDAAKVLPPSVYVISNGSARQTIIVK